MAKIGVEENKAIAEEVADKGIVLVKNIQEYIPNIIQKNTREFYLLM